MIDIKMLKPDFTGTYLPAGWYFRLGTWCADAGLYEKYKALEGQQMNDGECFEITNYGSFTISPLYSFSEPVNDGKWEQGSSNNYTFIPLHNGIWEGYKLYVTNSHKTKRLYGNQIVENEETEQLVPLYSHMYLQGITEWCNSKTVGGYKYCYLTPAAQTAMDDLLANFVDKYFLYTGEDDCYGIFTLDDITEKENKLVVEKEINTQLETYSSSCSNYSLTKLKHNHVYKSHLYKTNKIYKHQKDDMYVSQFNYVIAYEDLGEYPNFDSTYSVVKEIGEQIGVTGEYDSTYEILKDIANDIVGDAGSGGGTQTIDIVWDELETLKVGFYKGTVGNKVTYNSSADYKIKILSLFKGDVLTFTPVIYGATTNYAVITGADDLICISSLYGDSDKRTKTVTYTATEDCIVYLTSKRASSAGLTPITTIQRSGISVEHIVLGEDNATISKKFAKGLVGEEAVWCDGNSSYAWQIHLNKGDSVNFFARLASGTTNYAVVINADTNIVLVSSTGIPNNGTPINYTATEGIDILLSGNITYTTFADVARVVKQSGGYNSSYDILKAIAEKKGLCGNWNSSYDIAKTIALEYCNVDYDLLVFDSNYSIAMYILQTLPTQNEVELTTTEETEVTNE